MQKFFFTRPHCSKVLKTFLAPNFQTPSQFNPKQRPPRTPAKYTHPLYLPAPPFSSATTRFEQNSANFTPHPPLQKPPQIASPAPTNNFLLFGLLSPKISSSTRPTSQIYTLNIRRPLFDPPPPPENHHTPSTKFVGRTAR